MAVAIPVQELTLDAIRNMKMVARRRLVQLMITAGKAQNRDQVTIREGFANSDFGLTNGTETEEFVPAATTANTDLAYINSALGNNKYAAIYSFSIVTATVRPPIVGIQFKVGTGGANTLADLEIQRGYAYEYKMWYLDDPIVYQPTDTVYVVLRNAVSQAVGAVMVALGAFLAEPAGQTTL